LKTSLLKKDLILLKREPLIIAASLLTVFIFLLFAFLRSQTPPVKVAFSNLGYTFITEFKNNINEYPGRIELVKVPYTKQIQLIDGNYCAAGIARDNDTIKIFVNNRNPISRSIMPILEITATKISILENESVKFIPVKKKYLEGEPENNSLSLIILIILCVNTPFNFALIFTGKEVDDRTIYLLIKSGVNTFEITFYKSLLAFIATLICIIIITPFLIMLKIVIANFIQLFVVMLYISFIFSFLGTFTATLIGDLPFKSIISFIAFVISTSIALQFGSFPDNIKNAIIYVPWFNSLTCLHNAMTSASNHWLILIIYVPIYVLLVYFSGQYWLIKARK